VSDAIGECEIELSSFLHVALDSNSRVLSSLPSPVFSTISWGRTSLTSQTSNNGSLHLHPTLTTLLRHRYQHEVLRLVRVVRDGMITMMECPFAPPGDRVLKIDKVLSLSVPCGVCKDSHFYDL